MAPGRSGEVLLVFQLYAELFTWNYSHGIIHMRRDTLPPEIEKLQGPHFVLTVCGAVNMPKAAYC